MVCLRNICINTRHKGDDDDNNNNKQDVLVTSKAIACSAVDRNEVCVLFMEDNEVQEIPLLR